MSSVAELVDAESLRRIADPETYSRGIELAKRVRMAAFGPMRVMATVMTDEPADVELTAGPAGLAWTCSSGDASPALICPHAIAVAAATWRRSSLRQ